MSDEASPTYRVVPGRSVRDRILDAIYGVRSRKTLVEGIVLLLGPDELQAVYGDLVNTITSPSGVSLLGLPVMLTATPGIQFAWPPGAIREVVEERRKTGGA